MRSKQNILLRKKSVAFNPATNTIPTARHQKIYYQANTFTLHSHIRQTENIGLKKFNVGIHVE